ncbi:MAG: DUF3972 domain-containing protein [Sulfurovum sp.]|nr:DUF3972 domain-containing protein [Sulfurovum sp.]
METLMKPAEYAKELGISRQAVYAKIKKGILTAKEVEGKLYIVVDTDAKAQAAPQVSPPAPKNRPPAAPSVLPEEYRKLLAAKEETIAVLKETVEDLKESNRQISTTLKGEIDLLKSAFSEMRSLYMHRIEQLKAEEPGSEGEDLLEADIEAQGEAETSRKWISAKRFLKQVPMAREKEKEKLLRRLKKACKKGDTRLCKIDGKLKIDVSQGYADLLE